MILIAQYQIKFQKIYSVRIPSASGVLFRFRCEADVALSEEDDFMLLHMEPGGGEGFYAF